MIWENFFFSSQRHAQQGHLDWEWPWIQASGWRKCGLPGCVNTTERLRCLKGSADQSSQPHAKTRVNRQQMWLLMAPSETTQHIYHPHPRDGCAVMRELMSAKQPFLTFCPVLSPRGTRAKFVFIFCTLLLTQYCPLCHCIWSSQWHWGRTRMSLDCLQETDSAAAVCV